MLCQLNYLSNTNRNLSPRVFPITHHSYCVILAQCPHPTHLLPAPITVSGPCCTVAGVEGDWRLGTGEGPVTRLSLATLHSLQSHEE